MEKSIKIKSAPLVSVIIGAYNREKLIRRCLESVFNQSYVNIEVIVIDDCSSDDTPKVLTEYKLKYPEQFKFSINEQNMGISYNCNKAYILARGQYIALIGDDDFWTDRDKIKKQVNVLKNDTNIGISGTWWQEFDAQKSTYNTPSDPKDWRKEMLSGGGIICGSTPLIKKEAWVAAGGFDEKQKRGTDSDLFRRIILSGYKGNILHEITTSVDVSVNRKRMTCKNNISMFGDHIDSMEYNLNKLSKYYDQYPEARAKYYERLSVLYLGVYREAGGVKNLKECRRYIKMSIRHKFSILVFVKLLRAYTARFIR
jgi:glycosyltransferase involved in cell wall biosynthesis